MLPAPLPRDFVRARVRALVARLNAIAESEDMDGLRFFTEVAEQGWVALQLGRATLPGPTSETDHGPTRADHPPAKPVMPPEAKPTRPTRLSKLDRLILSKLKPAGQTATRLANLCDHDCDQHFRSRLRKLRDAGLAAHEEPLWSLSQTNHGPTTEPTTAA